MMPALEGFLAVTIEHALAAPLCSARLADAGARVIKIERAEGDFARHYDDVVHGESAYFVWVNQGKESAVLDLKDEADLRVLQNILGKADVFLQNLAPGAAARLGLRSETLLKKFPSLIICNISGYGETGPYKNMKAYDMLVQCETGLASVTGSPDAPGRVGISVCDIAAGLTAYQGILEAIISRGKNGQGRIINVSMFDALAEWMNVPYLHQVYGGRAPERVGVAHPSIAPYGVFRTSDGAQVVIGVQNEREWLRLCTKVGQRPDLAEDVRFQSNAARVEHREELDIEVAGMIVRLTRNELMQRLDQAAIAFAELKSMDEFSHHPQLKLHTANTPSGPVDLIAPVGKQNAPAASVPGLGEHSEAIRIEFSESIPKTPD